MNRNLSPQLRKGIYGGPRGRYGNYLVANLSAYSGSEPYPKVAPAVPVTVATYAQVQEHAK